MNKAKIAIIILAVALTLAGVWIILARNKNDKNAAPEDGATKYFLREIEDKEILANANRPDASAIGGKLFLAYKEGPTPLDGRFQAAIFDANLKAIKTTSIAPMEMTMLTDIRVSSDSRHNFWYAYESVLSDAPSCGGQIVNSAIYDQNLNLKTEKNDLSTGCTNGPARLRIPVTQIKENMQASDDPTPFFYDNKYYILNRAWDGPVQHIRVYDEEFNRLEYFTLDISQVFSKGEMLSQNSLSKDGNNVYLVGGIANNPPNMAGSYSNIYAIPLAADLKGFKGGPIKLTNNSGEYDTRVTTSFYYPDDVLFINYHDLRAGNQYLEAFDAKHNFKSLGRAKFQEGLVGDGHSSFTIIGHKIYLFYVKSPNRVNVKVIEIGTPGGIIDIKTAIGQATHNFFQTN